MKIKYIFSMVAGLIVLVTASCSEKTTTDSDAAEKASESTAEAVTPAAETTTETPEAPEAPEATSPSAYYVMFSGKG